MAYTTIDDPSAHFQIELYTGNSGTNAISFSGNSDMKPDLVWNKRYDVGYNHVMWDSSRGVSKYVNSNAGNAEGTFNYLTSFDTDGVTFGNADQAVNVSGGSYILWNWRANEGTTSSNTNGSETTTVQANTTAGFSIVLGSFTGSTETYGHGLGVAPDVVFWKNRSNTNSWLFFTTAVDGTHDYGIINQGNSFSATSYDLPTSTVFSGNDDNNTNFVAYCFAQKQGYSRFGSFVGRGNADTSTLSRGHFVYTGFSPALVMIKSSSTTANWQVYSNKRPNYGNTVIKKLGWNRDTHENGSDLGTDTQNNIEMLSNGFRCTTGNTDTNSTGQTYFYMAFAESPFVTSTGIPTTAR